MKKRKSRRFEWVRCVAACTAILTVAWLVVTLAVMAFTKAWVEEPRPEPTRAQMEIAAETLEQLKGE